MLVHPRCAKARQDDLEEVEEMIAASETEIARDELRWLISECHNFLAAHTLLGDLAMAENDVRLARGHFGYAYQIGLKAIDAAGHVKPLPSRHAANRAFFAAGSRPGQMPAQARQTKNGQRRDCAAAGTRPKRSAGPTSQVVGVSAFLGIQAFKL